jgi:CheY-like chemotaxis protein
MKTILIIEKNLQMRENLCELLELAGFKVLNAETNTAGFKQAVLHHPDVIVCDMMMPETTGILFRLLIKEERTTRDIPVIFYSPGSLPLALLTDLKEGGDLYIKDPFTNEELLVAIDCCLNTVESKPSLVFAEL